MAIIGEVRWFAYEKTESTWQDLDGKPMSKSLHSTLYKRLGGVYGEDEHTFNLPNSQGKIFLSTGNGRAIGLELGSETQTLTIENLPPHGHDISALADSANEDDPSNHYLAGDKDGGSIYTNQEPDSKIRPTENTGGGEAFSIMPPCLVLKPMIYVGKVK